MAIKRFNFRLIATILLTQVTFSLAQIIPANNSIINYTDLVFDFPPVDNASIYELAFFEKGQVEPFHLQLDSTNVSFCDFFRFGKSYQWRYKAINETNEVVYTSDLLEFTTNSMHATDTIIYNYLIRSNYSNPGYILNDFTKNMVNFQGKEIWHFPKLKNFTLAEKLSIRDLRMTKSGNFTALITPGIALEFDRDGNVIWLAPSSQLEHIKGKENYHHDFRKLESGNYMILSEEEQVIKLKPQKSIKDKLLEKENIKLDKGDYFASGIYGTIVEFDKDGKIVWRWNSGPFFAELTETGWNNEDSHANAFYMDEKNNILYVGFRHISLIVKVDKSTGKVIECYGNNLSSKYKFSLGGEFALQHSIEKTVDNSLLIFNNANCENDETSISDVLFISESDGKQPAKVQSRISCLIDGTDDGRAVKYGSADQLPDGNYLIGIGGNGRVIVADKSNNNEIVHDMVLRSYENNAWGPNKFYRCHYASSLYPVYFSIKKIPTGIQITNEGTIADHYIVKTTNKAGKHKSSEPMLINPGQKLSFEFNKSDNYSCEVISMTNTLLTRTIQ
jgi:hypothetical protein